MLFTSVSNVIRNAAIGGEVASDRPEPTLLLQTAVDPSHLTNVLLHPLFFRSFLENPLV